MRKQFNATILFSLLCLFFFSSCNNNSSLENNESVERESEDHEGYDGPAERAALEFEKTKDPATGIVPIERLWDAMTYTEALKQNNNYRTLSVLWQERGPSYDSVGPSNGNWRGTTRTGAYSSGRINGFLVDAADPTGNTVLCGGANGGIWKCTNFNSASPTWVIVNDFLANMSIVSFCQDPTNLSTMYVSTGEPWGNVDAVRGYGVFKSTNGGNTWTLLPSTTGVTRSFKILCDAAGNIYHATRGSGLLRSSNGGSTWTTITPTSTSTNCSDIEISSTGRLHASFGFSSGTIYYRYTSNPATVSSGTWNSSSGLRVSGATANRFEMAVSGDVVYGVTTNSSNNVDSCYKSTNGGASWQKMNSTAFPTGITNTQGWYDLTLGVNPDNSSDIIIGGLDAYRSVDNGQTVSRITYWVNSNPYVHADHHFIEWWKVNDFEDRILIATDGGLFQSTDGGFTFTDKNKGLAIKQFYSCAIHPTNSNYILGGTQDNGSHQFNNPGLSYSIEVTGGDGAYVAIDQDEPQFQFTSYVYNQYRRSTNGGASWSSFNLSSSTGLFINPFAYDNAQNIMLCCSGTNNFLRWNDPQTAANTAAASRTTVSLTELNGSATAITVSPYEMGTAFFGSSTGRIVKVMNTATTSGAGSADVTALTTPLTGAYTSCIAIGTNESNLLAVYSNYGINNVWYSNNGGVSWTAIDGNLPDMPVRWAVFHPTNNNKVLIATETGVYTTGQINGSSTQWFPSPGFPLVRTDMLQLRKTDNTVVAATHGRGMWSGNILDILPLKKITLSGSLQSDNIAALKWQSVDATNQVKYYVQYSNDGINFSQIAQLNHTTLSYKHQLNATTGYYRIMGTEPNSSPIFSNVVFIKTNKPSKGLQLRITPNPLINSGNFIVSSDNSGTYEWQLCNIQGSILQRGNGNIAAESSTNQPINVAKLSTGMYVLRVIQGKEKITQTFIKQ